MAIDSEPQVNLAYRLDALCAAASSLQSDPKTEPTARELVTLIRASSEFRNMNMLAQAAQQAESANSTEFPGRLRSLIICMHQELNQRNPNPGVIIVTQDKSLITALKPELESRGYPVVVTNTPSEARGILATQTVGVCILDLVLAGQDGRDVISEFRTLPGTASLLIVAIEPHLAPSGLDNRALSDDDAFFRKPVNAADVANFLSLRLRRGPTKNRAARRDPTTGTPNRAACYESFSQIQRSCSEGEPISFALFGIHRFNTLVRNGGRAVREDLIRQLGSLLSASFRSSDVVARWGVSEFAVIMPGEDHYGATKAIEKVLPALNRQMITTPAGKPLPITLCAGLTLVNNQTPLEDAAATAECHLYMAFHQAWHNPRKNWLVSDAIQASRRSETIALLQPDPMMAKVLQQVLERETFKVQSFSSSKELRSALNQQSFNLLIMDGNLPEAEGQAIMEEIRGIPNQRQLLTMMIVGDDSGIERSLKLGVHDYAIKPLSMPRVRSQILRILWQREESRSHARMTVMVVDHEVPQLLISGTALHQLGECQVLLARGPQDAIRRLLHTQPHYLVLDMTMPEMSGEEFMRAIPDLDWLKNMEIIMAAPASFSLPAQNSARKVLGVISRPYRPIKFIKEIRDLIPMLQNDTLPPPPFLPAPLEAEVQRILSL